MFKSYANQYFSNVDTTYLAGRELIGTDHIQLLLEQFMFTQPYKIMQWEIDPGACLPSLTSSGLWLSFR